MKMRNGFEKRAGGCRKSFEQRMVDSHKAHATGFRIAAGAVVVTAMLGLGLMGFAIWVVIKLLEHFSVL